MKLAAMAAPVEINGMHDEWISWLINVMMIYVHGSTAFSLFNKKIKLEDAYLLVLI
ncbi:hypothetical protein [Chitinophaga dinghuensis]|uniref:hypothetical protein n=1 Tax=Chitinophaga dinghuensis TaxID=1539050 RepID=UPI001B86EDE0|nr:hypothetical protein [Chitinophaga dinghuensis]